MSDFPSQHKQIAVDVYTAGGTHLVFAAELSSGFERVKSLRSVSRLACLMHEMTEEALRSFARRLLLNRILRVENITLVETVSVFEGYAFIDVIYSCSGTTVTVADLTPSDGGLPPNMPAARGFTRRRDMNGFGTTRQCGTQLSASDPYADDMDITRNFCSLWEEVEMVSLCEFAKDAVATDATVGTRHDCSTAAYLQSKTQAVSTMVTLFCREAECMIVAASEFLEDGSVVMDGTRTPVALGIGLEPSPKAVLGLAMLGLAGRDCVSAVETYAMRDATCLVGSGCTSADIVKDIFSFDDGWFDVLSNEAETIGLQAGSIGIVKNRNSDGYIAAGCADDLDVDDAPAITAALRVLTHPCGLAIAGTLGQGDECRDDAGYGRFAGLADLQRFHKHAVRTGAGQNLSLS